jgi:SulP family sulfate permease
MKSLFKELAEDATSPRMVPALALGLVIGVLLVVIGVSFAAMIFSGPLAPLATRGAGLTLFGAASLCGFLALSSSFRAAISTPQDAPVAVLATMGVPVAAAMGMSDPNATFATMLAAMSIATLATGIALTAIGQFRLTRYFRFMPYPVVGGFLAGGGWMLVKGGISVMSSISPTIDTLSMLFESAHIWKWSPGAIYAISLWLVLKRWSHFLILPCSIVMVTAAYYVAFHVLGISLIDARAEGILLSGVPSSGLWPAFSLSDLQAVHWDVVFDQTPIMITVMLVTMMGLLLNISGLELGSGTDIDFDREFRNAGLANTLSGLGGSAPGSHTLSLSLLCSSSGAYTRLAGLITAGVIAAVLFMGGSVLEYFPLPVLGGLLVFLGIDIMDSWLRATSRRLPLSDYLVLGVIFLVICFSGFLEGVAVGLVITVVLFIIRLSRVDIIHGSFTGLTLHSRINRSIPQRTILQQHGEHIRGYTLNGYLFFGSASLLVETLKQELRKTPQPWSILLDFKGVSGFDISAANAFQRFIASAHAEHVRIILTETPPHFISMLQRILPVASFKTLVTAQDLDRGLEACEETILNEYAERTALQANAEDMLFEQSVDDMMAHLDRQVLFEELVEAMHPWLQECHYENENPLVLKGEVQQGLQMLVWGSATATDLDGGARLAHLRAGDVLVPQAAFTPFVAREHIVADGPCRTALLTAQARLLMEQETPDLALRLDRYIISSWNGTA